MSDEQVVPETRGVTARVLTMVDLAREIEGMARSTTSDAYGDHRAWRHLRPDPRP